MGNTQSQQATTAPSLATMAQSTARLSSSRPIIMSTIASPIPTVSPMSRNGTFTQSTPLISVSTEQIISTITQAAAPAAAQPQGTVTIEITTTQAAAPAVVQSQATTTIEITTTETASPQSQMAPSTIPSAASASSTNTDKGTTGTAKQAGLNSPSDKNPPSASPALQGAQLDPTMPSITQPKVGPFSPVAAILGGIPNKNVDVPITIVFLILFIVGAASHFIRHEINSKRGHKFVISDMIFDFCMVRNVTCIMRIVWAFRPENNSIVVAALIFENAGVVVLFAVNVVFTQRILRATHPNIGWNPIVSKAFLAILISVPMIIFWNIISLTISFFTLNPRSIQTTKNLLLFGSCWTLFLSLFPAIFVTLATAIPSSTPVEKFGAGRFRMKPIILITATALLVTGAITRLLGAVIEKPISAPSHLFSKPVFYTTGFMLEILVVYGYLFLRVDLRFWVPNGTGGPTAQGSAGSYTVKSEDDEEKLVDGSGDEGKLRARSSLYEKLYGNVVIGLDTNVPVSSAEKVSAAIADLSMNSRGEIFGTQVESPSEDVVLYAFRVGSSEDDMPRRPPRATSWAEKSGGVGTDAQEFM
ncbi:hypothetical protein BCIN_03g08060 [Botrytis cinerea B05.10]|uniref:Family c-likeg-protein-coupled receptor protein n=1 Tax=Botryotinia fuckeliana (strain B05.10) TaxID=332648 RepID=A0A384JDC9_BOTFB|nr:hypothetical protein BCIN_03g08060 [Botrytis cinerea B05.10]ATZ48615.1 hypothetical protein BCIN_03g08060 [Botrytis cinerea B05.10]